MGGLSIPIQENSESNTKMRNVHQIKEGPSKARTGWRKPTSKQLEYLADLGYEGEPPEDRLEASDLIEIYKHRRKKMVQVKKGVE